MDPADRSRTSKNCRASQVAFLAHSRRNTFGFSIGGVGRLP